MVYHVEKEGTVAVGRGGRMHSYKELGMGPIHEKHKEESSGS